MLQSLVFSFKSSLFMGTLSTYWLYLKDLRNQLYESYYLNFISAISRSKLEDIANAALAANAVTQVAKVRTLLIKNIANVKLTSVWKLPVVYI